MKRQLIKEAVSGVFLSLLIVLQWQIKDNTKEQVLSLKTSSKTLDSLRLLEKIHRIDLLVQDSLINVLQIKLLDKSDDTIDSLTNEEFNDLRNRADSEL